MIELIIDGKEKRLIAEKWDELTGRQLVAVSAVICTEVRPVAKALKLFKILSGLSDKKMRTIPHEVIQAQLLPMTEWLNDADLWLTKQLLPRLKLGRRVYLGPSDDLSNLRFVEFNFAETALNEWHQDKTNEFALYRFVAILYRTTRKDYDLKEDPDGDKRELFNANHIDSHALYLQRKLPFNYVLGIMIWYQGCRMKIAQLFPDIFSGGDEGGESSYFTLMRAIAKEGTYGPFAEVEQLHLYTALMEMECSIKDSKAMKEQLDQAKNAA